MDAHEFLLLVAGELCPCGHMKSDHDEPSGDLLGEVFGACRVEGCGCEGVIDARMGD